jgi:hypothetical protein
VSLLERVADALVDAGRDVEVDADVLTIDVASPGPGGRVLALVRPLARTVTFYAVHPNPVPAGALPAVSELVLRATNDLFAAALELDLATGAVAARCAVVLGEAEPTRPELAALLVAAVEEAEEAAAAYADAIDAVTSGATTPAAATAGVRRAPLDALVDEVVAVQQALRPQPWL